MQAYLGLGANIGKPACQLAAALAELAKHPRIAVAAVSPVYRTRPVGFADQPDFLNIVVAVNTSLDPHALLEVTSGIENILGRVRSIKNGPRTVDIDILIYGSTYRCTPDLTLPHPRMTKRQFVLVPLADIAPHLILPGGTPIARIADRNDPDVCLLGPLAPLARDEANSHRGACEC